jgi:hypothetical protein
LASILHVFFVWDALWREGIARVLAKVIKHSNAGISHLSLQPHHEGGGRGRAGEGHWAVHQAFTKRLKERLLR